MDLSSWPWAVRQGVTSNVTPSSDCMWQGQRSLGQAPLLRCSCPGTEPGCWARPCTPPGTWGDRWAQQLTRPAPPCSSEDPGPFLRNWCLRKRCQLRGSAAAPQGSGKTGQSRPQVADCTRQLLPAVAVSEARQRGSFWLTDTLSVCISGHLGQRRGEGQHWRAGWSVTCQFF